VQEASEILGKKLIAQRVGQIGAFEFSLKHVWDGGETELPQIAIDKRINSVGVGAFEKKRPP